MLDKIKGRAPRSVSRLVSIMNVYRLIQYLYKYIQTQKYHFHSKSSVLRLPNGQAGGTAWQVYRGKHHL